MSVAKIVAQEHAGGFGIGVASRDALVDKDLRDDLGIVVLAGGLDRIHELSVIV